MSVDPEIIPGLLILAAELLALAAVGFVVARVALRQTDDRLALAQGLIIGPALWGLAVNLLLYAIPGLAGVLTGWAAILLLGAGLAWRASHPLRPRLRTVAGFTVAALALFWVALAGRQLLGIPDAHLHLGLTASIQAGGHPPTFPWNPGLPTAYHYGANLLTGHLAPPIGPDTGFTIEIIDAYIWTSFALVVGALVRQRGSWIAVLAFAPLLLTAGAWTQVHYAPPRPASCSFPLRRIYRRPPRAFPPGWQAATGHRLHFQRPMPWRSMRRRPISGSLFSCWPTRWPSSCWKGPRLVVTGHGRGSWSSPRCSVSSAWPTKPSPWPCSGYGSSSRPPGSASTGRP